MKKYLMLILSIGILSCVTTKNPESNYVNYKKKSPDQLPLNLNIRDSLNLITPYIEIYNNSKRKKKVEEKRNYLRNFVINMVQNELGNSEYYEIPFLFNDYLTINTVLEVLSGESWKYPNYIFSAPSEILITEKKYSILITVISSYNISGNGTLIVSIINNHSKVVELTDKYKFTFNPLDEALLEELIKDSLKKFK